MAHNYTEEFGIKKYQGDYIDDPKSILDIDPDISYTKSSMRNIKLKNGMNIVDYLLKHKGSPSYVLCGKNLVIGFWANI